MTLLGTGTSVPAPDRSPAAALVEADGERVLVDCGPGAVRRLAQAGCGPGLVSEVLLTHLHPDHCADLVTLLFALRRPVFAGRPPLRVSGPRGTTALVGALRAAWPGWLEPRGVEVVLRDLDPGPFDAGRLGVAGFAVEHTDASFAYRFRGEGGGTAALGGDSPDCPGLRAAARRADLFVCEATFPDGRVRGAHLSARNAARIAREEGVRRLVLTHLDPAQDASDPLAEARDAFPGPVVAARDLTAFTV